MSDFKELTPNKGIPPNRLGYIAKAKESDNIILTVEQDMTLKKGNKLILRNPKDNFNYKVKNGYMSPEEARKKYDKILWKLHEVELLPVRE